MTHYKGATQTDHYGREIPKHTHGTINLDSFSSSSKEIIEKVREFYNKNVNKTLTVHDLNLSANHIRTKGSADGPEQLDLFVDYDKKQLESEKDRRRQEAILKIKKRYGKNAILRGTNFEEGATMRDRNRQIGGHKA
jgi:DNA polymerase V